MSSLKYWVWLSALTNLKPRTRAELIEAFGEAQSVYFATERQLAESCRLTDGERALLADKNLDRANEILQFCQENHVSVVVIGDSAYPKRLMNIFDPPVVLYVKGTLPAIDEQAAIAVVGTRKATPYGISMAERLGFELSRSGGLVVTGLAAGVDSASAKGALKAGGSCVGVLGCGIDQVYPVWNRELYDDVAAVGALISEYPPETPLSGKNFPERNRIMAGLSVGVTVIEAPMGSGALITAARALEQGREVFAVPGNADAENCAGSNMLIKDGAQLITCGWDILSEFKQLFPEKLSKPDPKKPPQTELGGIEQAKKLIAAEQLRSQKAEPETGVGFAKLRVKTDRKRIDNEKQREYIDLKEQLTGLTETQLKIISVMDSKSKHVDDIISQSGLSAPVVLSELTIMQIKGFVFQESGKRFTLNIRLK